LLAEDSEIVEVLERQIPGLTASSRAAIEQLNKEVGDVVSALTNAQAIEPRPRNSTEAIVKSLQEVIDNLGHEVSRLDGAKKDEVEKQEEAEYLVLQNKGIVLQHKAAILKYAKGQIRAKKLRDCINALATRRITDKQSEFNKAVITKELSEALNKELIQLGLDYIKPQFELHPEIGGLKSRIVIAGLRSSGLKKSRAGVLGILSEGEALVIALAAFFAELELAPSFSVVVFDDPVSSLDHMWRDAVAQRIAKLAETRQVIVLTHDLLFLHDLDGHITRNVSQAYRAYGLERQSNKTGVVLLGAQRPVNMLNIQDRIAALRDLYKVLKGIYDSKGADCEAYRSEAENTYKVLRLAWERAVEEVLLDKTIFRFRRGIQTKDIAKRLHDVLERDDYTCIENAMTKLSQEGGVHDEASAARSRVALPQEVNDDIDALEVWCRKIKKRRNAMNK
jgi:hypothetical protein